MGSAVSITVGLALTWIVFLLLPEHAERLDPERGPLLQSIALMGLLAAAAAVSFYGELRERPWRVPAHAVLLAALAITARVYWPE